MISVFLDTLGLVPLGGIKSKVSKNTDICQKPRKHQASDKSHFSTSATTTLDTTLPLGFRAVFGLLADGVRNWGPSFPMGISISQGSRFSMDSGLGVDMDAEDGNTEVAYIDSPPTHTLPASENTLEILWHTKHLTTKRLAVRCLVCYKISRVTRRVIRDRNRARIEAADPVWIGSSDCSTIPVREHSKCPANTINYPSCPSDPGHSISPCPDNVSVGQMDTRKRDIQTLNWTKRPRINVV
eukprot:gene1487-biopygen1203